MTFNVTFTKEELPALRKVLDRAMNTWDPNDQPVWLGEFSDRLDQVLANPEKAVLSSLSVGKSTEASQDLQTRILEQIRISHRHAAASAIAPDLQALILDTIRAQQRAGGLLYRHMKDASELRQEGLA